MEPVNQWWKWRGKNTKRPGGNSKVRMCTTTIFNCPALRNSGPYLSRKIHNGWVTLLLEREREVVFFLSSILLNI